MHSCLTRVTLFPPQVVRAASLVDLMSRNSTTLGFTRRATVSCRPVKKLVGRNLFSRLIRGYALALGPGRLAGLRYRPVLYLATSLHHRFIPTCHVALL
jgi:hypothetical protein